MKGIKLEDYNKLEFDMILMSPPCQPFTRQGNQKGQDDPRAKSFLSLLEIIPKLAKKPKFILMENVRGFEADPARDRFKDMLRGEKYRFQVHSSSIQQAIGDVFYSNFLWISFLFFYQ